MSGVKTPHGTPPKRSADTIVASPAAAVSPAVFEAGIMTWKCALELSALNGVSVGNSTMFIIILIVLAIGAVGYGSLLLSAGLFLFSKRQNKTKIEKGTKKISCLRLLACFFLAVGLVFGTLFLVWMFLSFHHS